MKTIKQIEKKISKLSPKMMEELDNYLDYLINKQEYKGKKLKQDWAGDLKEIDMSSVYLQKKALDWRKTPEKC